MSNHKLSKNVYLEKKTRSAVLYIMMSQTNVAFLISNFRPVLNVL